jgi:hypothetical protein
MKAILLVLVMLSVGCATVTLPLADGDKGEVMTFKGFASTMLVTVPGGVDAEGNVLADKQVEINAHALETPLLEGLKAIAPYIAIMGSN